jgi:arylsulfatase A-like enzyme
LPSLVLGCLILPLIVTCRGPREGESAAAQAGPPPNVVVVVVDVLRADRLGVNGYSLPTTPNIDGLARDGVSFSAAFANASWTKPATATLLTSLMPSSHGALDVADEAGTTGILDEELTTLAEIFSGAGYRTGAFIVQPHLKAKFGFAQGFDEFHRLRGKVGGRQNKLLSEFVEAAGERPFLAYVHYIEVHWPYNKRLPGQEQTFGSTAIDPEPPISQLGELSRWVEDHWSPRNRAALMARYDQGVAFADAVVGDLLERLRRAGRYQNTIIVVTSDHGEGFMEHGLVGHGLVPHDEQVHVPLVVKVPARFGVAPGERRDSLVSLIDVGPTLLDLAGVETPPVFEGTSFRMVLEGVEDPTRQVHIQTEHGSALRTRSHKLIVRSDGEIELYDLTADRDEMVNLAVDVCDGVCSELRAQLPASTVPRGSTRGTWSAEDIEELVALGYLEEDS